MVRLRVGFITRQPINIAKVDMIETTKKRMYTEQLPSMLTNQEGAVEGAREDIGR